MAALMLLPLVVASASSTVDLLGRDAAGRPLEVAATSSSGAQAGLLRTLDPEGAPLTQVDQSGKGWSFSRDLGTRELLGAQEIGGGSASVATGYDLSGLRATHSDLLASGAWSTNAAGETSQARGRPVVNDLLGRVTSLDGWNHTYSCDGLLLSSEPASPSEGSRRSVHAYDALGRRVRTTVEAYVGGQWTAFSTTERDFLGRLPLGIETSFVGGSSKSWRFLRGPDASGTLEGAGGARGVLAVLKDASTWKAVAADTLGNVLALAGTSGDFTRRTFDPWGNPLTRDASGSLRASTLQERRADYDALPLAWASQEVDPDTGLSHYHFREYSPSLGGWLTLDPIGIAGGYLNLRSYLGNRPADLLDTWGLYWDDSMPMPQPQDPFLKGILDGYGQRTSADAPADEGWYGFGRMVGNAAAAIDSPEVQEQVKKNLKGLGTGVKRAITDIPDEVADIANGIASAASKAVDPETYIEMADAIAMLYKCRQNPCCWKKLMERLGEMPSATLEAAARKLKDLGNLKQEEVFEMLGKEWGRAAMMGAAAEAGGSLSVAKAAENGAGIVAKNGTKVTGFTEHGIDRVIGDGAKRAGTRPQAILDALKNPKEIVGGVDEIGRPFQVFKGKDARVVVNPETGKVISVNPSSGAGAH